MFKVNKNVTFILDNNVTLQGHSGNNGSMVRVEGGAFKMNSGATITGNTSTEYQSSGGVFVTYGTFEMTGGSITNNTVTGSSTTASHSQSGGGVSVCSFQYGPGVFTMSGGTISNNNAHLGGGVHVAGTFTMKGGTITGNIASGNGGGICLSARATFTKTGGTITGYNSDQTNGNAVRDEDGNILARRGHAVWVDPFRGEGIRKETTSGLKDNLSYGGSKGLTGTGAWDK
jgi:parallel beta-helix repeat protein